MAAASLFLACSLARASSARRFSTAAAPSPFSTHVIRYEHQAPLTRCLRIHYIPCASSSRSFTSAMSASATSSCRFSSANSSVRLATEHLATYIGKATYYTWDYDPLCAVIFDNTQSLRGYYLYRAHFIYAALSKGTSFRVP